MWKTTNDILRDISAARESLRETRNVDIANAEARLLVAAIKAVEVNLRHARLTGQVEDTCIKGVALK